MVWCGEFKFVSVICPARAGASLAEARTLGWDLSSTYGLLSGRRVGMGSPVLQRTILFYSPSPLEGTKQVLPTLQRELALPDPTHLGWGGSWPKVLDGIQWTMTGHSFASRLEAVFVYVECGGGGMCCPVARPPLLQRRGGTQLLTANEPAGGLLQRGSAVVARGRRGICNSPVVAAPMASPAPLTVDSGALLLLD